MRTGAPVGCRGLRGQFEPAGQGGVERHLRKHGLQRSLQRHMVSEQYLQEHERRLHGFRKRRFGRFPRQRRRRRHLEGQLGQRLQDERRSVGDDRHAAQLRSVEKILYGDPCGMPFSGTCRRNPRLAGTVHRRGRTHANEG